MIFSCLTILTFRVLTRLKESASCTRLRTTRSSRTWELKTTFVGLSIRLLHEASLMTVSLSIASVRCCKIQMISWCNVKDAKTGMLN
ncbi:hypothetical protein PHJA_001596000 [Phtheirospermum japonicum]|uniref:Uncharacterized protein n=1 Tax=Phtheirospermum japonicum TaxID=374723 RepID=A0A830C5W7_9LAMI|nr:hypothetical protein PHJA_001596000 [Phtheirospermum japonicum]